MSAAWSMALLAIAGCTETLAFDPVGTAPDRPGLHADELQLQAQLASACGAIARAHEAVEVAPGQLEGFLESPPPATGRREAKQQAKALVIARNELTYAEGQWGRALQMGACVEDLCCEHVPTGGGEPTTMCSQQAVDPGRAHVERFWITLANGLCLQASGEAPTQQQCEDLPQQRWFVTEADAGAVLLRSAADRRCLSVADGASGTLTLAECGPGPAQRFESARAGDDQRALRHVFDVCEPSPNAEDSGEDGPPPQCESVRRCLQAPWSDAPGAALMLAECDGGPHQGFGLTTSRLLQTRELDPQGSGCGTDSLPRPLGICPRVSADDAADVRFFALPAAERGLIRWSCDGREGTTRCPEDTRYVELRREGERTVIRCYA